ncbi:hypothetical protein DIPPA_56319 [Diplonema papillatum]|nr:hypothetical protein DIPPA_56319 [Diplonema papillatum]
MRKVDGKRRNKVAQGHGLAAVREGGEKTALHRQWGANVEKLCSLWDELKTDEETRKDFVKCTMTRFNVSNLRLIEEEVATLASIRTLKQEFRRRLSVRHQLIDRLASLARKTVFDEAASLLLRNELRLLVALIRAKTLDVFETWASLAYHALPGSGCGDVIEVDELSSDVHDVVFGSPLYGIIGFSTLHNPFLLPTCGDSSALSVFTIRDELKLTSGEHLRIALLLKLMEKKQPYGAEWVPASAQRLRQAPPEVRHQMLPSLQHRSGFEQATRYPAVDEAFPGPSTQTLASVSAAAVAILTLASAQVEQGMSTSLDDIPVTLAGTPPPSPVPQAKEEVDRHILRTARAPLESETNHAGEIGARRYSSTASFARPWSTTGSSPALVRKSTLEPEVPFLQIMDSDNETANQASPPLTPTIGRLERSLSAATCRRSDEETPAANGSVILGRRVSIGIEPSEAQRHGSNVAATKSVHNFVRTSICEVRSADDRKASVMPHFPALKCFLKCLVESKANTATLKSGVSYRVFEAVQEAIAVQYAPARSSAEESGSSLAALATALLMRNEKCAPPRNKSIAKIMSGKNSIQQSRALQALRLLERP